MIDLLSTILTIAFFAVMIAYVAGCARLGRAATDEGTDEETRS
jgi:hypothetical protein